MPLKVIGAGFGRTGTMSTYEALKQLGFPCYHMLEVLNRKANPAHLDFWAQVANTPAEMPHDWERVFANYTAAVDNPACCVWRELMRAYPDAKVLLTVHPGGPDAWYDSTIDTIYAMERMWEFRVLERLVPFWRKFGDMCHRLIWQRSHKDTMNDRRAAVAHYLEHIENVKTAVPAERLLIFSADQGWEPLCRFLDVPVPGGAFPNVNDRAAIRKMVANVARMVHAGIGIAAVAIAAALYASFSLIR